MNDGSRHFGACAHCSTALNTPGSTDASSKRYSRPLNLEEPTGWGQALRLTCCVSGDGRHEEAARKRLKMLPKYVERQGFNQVFIQCEIKSREHGKLLWRTLNDDISRSTKEEPWKREGFPPWIETWAISVADIAPGFT